jgi:hypothetical protein
VTLELGYVKFRPDMLRIEVIMLGIPIALCQKDSSGISTPELVEPESNNANDFLIKEVTDHASVSVVGPMAMGKEELGEELELGNSVVGRVDGMHALLA